MSVNRVLHIGLYKTGSTFLQKELFPKLLDISYVGDFSLKGGALAVDDQKTLLLSNEASCGYPYPIANHFSTERVS